MTEENTPKTDFFLKLSSEADMPSVLSAFYRQDPETGADDVGEPYLVMHTHDYAIDVVGVIHEPTGNMLTSDAGFEYPEVAALDGWHINIRILNDTNRADVEALSAYFVDPEPVTPSRVWA